MAGQKSNTLAPDRVWRAVVTQLASLSGDGEVNDCLRESVLLERQGNLWRVGVADETAVHHLSNGAYTAVADCLGTVIGGEAVVEFLAVGLPPLPAGRNGHGNGRAGGGRRTLPPPNSQPPPGMTPQAAWKAALKELELQMTRDTFNTWLKDAALLGQQDGVWTVGVAHARAKDWLENRLYDTIARTLATVAGTAVTLEFVVQESGCRRVGGNGRVPEEPEMPPPEGSAHRPEPDPEVQKKVQKKLATKKVSAKLKELNPDDPMVEQGRTQVNKKDKEREKKKIPTEGFVKVPRYALRFWQPILGKTAFSLWMALCEHYYFVEEGEEWPDIKTLIGEMGDNNRASILGREATATRQGTKGAITILEEHGFLRWRIEEHPSGNPRLRTHHFDEFVDEEDIKVLTPRQVAALLNEERQVEHALYMARFAQAENETFNYAEWCAETRWSYLLGEDFGE